MKAIFSPTFLLIVLMSFVTMNGFLVMSSYKVLAQRYSSGNDNTITLFACVGFLLFGTTRLAIREAVIRVGFKKVFSVVGFLQQITLVLLYLE